jgi:exopolysaccharide production protein ExoZ
MKEQLKFVQTLRGFAAITVVLFNLNAFSLSYFNHSLFTFNYGHPGFNFFFALTGFIITYVHFKETQHHSSTKKFLLKRFVRVFPFYWLVLLIIICLEFPGFQDKPTLRSAINPTTSDGLLNIMKNFILYPLPEPAGVIGITWGLSHALIFYLLFAIGIKLGWNAAKLIFVIWLLVILLHSFGIFPQSLLLEAIAGAVNIQILLGCIAGYLFVKSKLHLTTPQFALLLLASIVSIAGLTIWGGFERSNLLITTLTGISFSLILYYAASLDRNKLSQKPSKMYASQSLVLTGDAAYSIFLTHIIFIPYLCRAFNKFLNIQVVPYFFRNVLILIIFFLTVVAGIVTYLLIERPLLNFFRKKFRLKRQKPSWN